MSSPFESHPTWQSENPNLAKRDREQRRRHVAEMGPGPEERPTIKDVAAYFRETERKHLLHPDETRSGYALERELLTDLELALLDEDHERADRIRGLIWTYSSARRYPEQSLKRAVEAAGDIAADIREEPTERRGESPAEIREAEEARDAHAERIEELGNAVEMNVTGEVLRDLLPEIEDAFSSTLKQVEAAHRKARRRAEDRLSKLRILRDAAYQSYLFPVSTKVIHKSEFDRTRKSKKRVA